MWYSHCALWNTTKGGDTPMPTHHMTTPLILAVRSDDVDANGHVRGPAYLAYADHARWQLVQAAGVSLEALARARVGPVNLETTVRFRKELVAGDEVEISTAFTYAPKTGEVHQELRRRSDNAVVAAVHSITGLLDLDARRLVENHGERLREFADDPTVLGL